MIKVDETKEAKVEVENPQLVEGSRIPIKGVLREVQQGFREGRLFENTPKSLHGLPTAIPGSHVFEQLACAQDHSATLLAAALAGGGRTRKSDADVRYQRSSHTCEPGNLHGWGT